MTVLRRMVFMAAGGGLGPAEENENEKDNENEYEDDGGRRHPG